MGKFGRLFSMFVPQQLSIFDVFQVYGSVLPRTLVYGVIGAIEGGVLKWADPKVVTKEVWLHPYSLHIFGMVLGFSLVMRLQIAYQRLWEGASQCHQASAKWSDAAMQVICFDEASKDAFTDDGFEFRMLILHYCSLMNACALIDMRSDDKLAPGLMPINMEDPFLFRPNTTQALVPTTTDSDGNRQITRPRNSTGQEYEHTSNRAHTVPLQQVLRTRAHLKERTGLAFDSFEAIDAMERAVQPINYIPKSKRGLNEEVGDHSVAGRVRRQTTDMKEVRQASKKNLAKKTSQGSLSSFHFLKAMVLRTMSDDTHLELLHENSFDVLGGVSEAELAMLAPLPPSNRPFRVQTWMVRMMTNRLNAGGLAIPPPLLSRTYQVLSDGTAAAMQGRKVAHVEFPFALRQLLAVLITVFLVLAPICIGAFVDSVPLVSTLSFFVCIGYVSLNEVARELEMPFGLDANDLNLPEYQRDFNQKLAMLLDQSVPELGYQDTEENAEKLMRKSLSAAGGSIAVGGGKLATGVNQVRIAPPPPTTLGSPSPVALDGSVGAGHMTA